MITSINEAYGGFYFYTNVNPFEKNRGEEEQVDYDRLYNQKHIKERKNRHAHDNKKKKYDLESVDENDLYHYHFGDYYESMNNEEIHNNKEMIDCIQKEMNTFIFEDETKKNNRNRFCDSDDYSDSDSDNNEEEENNFTQFGDIFTFTLRSNPETKEKCFDTIKYFLYSSLLSLATHVVTTKSFFPFLLSIHSWRPSRMLFLLVSLAV